MKLKVAFIMQGNGTSWIGGTEYIKNLVTSCANLPPEERSQFEMVLICDDSFDLKNVSDIDPHLAKIYRFPSDLPEETFLPPPEPVVTQPIEAPAQAPAADQRPNAVSRMITRLLRKLGLKKPPPPVKKPKAPKAAKPPKPPKPIRRPNGRIADFLEREQIDFLYPVIFHQYDLPIGDTLGKCRWAGWLPDFQHRHMPEYYTPEAVAAKDKGLEIFFSDAKTVIFSSYNAENDYRQFFPSATAKAEVMRFATFPQASWYEGDPLAVQKRFNLPDRFLIVSNQFWQHKNHHGLFEAMALLRAEGAPVPDVICTGHPTDDRNPHYIDQLLRAIHEHGIAPHVRFLGLIGRLEQVQLVRRAVAVIQPSHFEGWSTIVEDSRILGKKMLMSDINVHKEQNPPGGAYFKYDDPRSLAEQLSKIWQEGTPGPDLEAEANARRAGVESALAYARRFLDIARSAG